MAEEGLGASGSWNLLLSEPKSLGQKGSPKKSLSKNLGMKTRNKDANFNKGSLSNFIWQLPEPIVNISNTSFELAISDSTSSHGFIMVSAYQKVNLLKERQGFEERSQSGKDLFLYKFKVYK